MATYTVQRGDSLSKIYKKLGYKTWQDLWHANRKVIGDNPSLIYAGQKYNYAGSGGSSGGSSSVSSTSTPPSSSVGKTIADAVEDPTRENFIKKYGLEEDLRPSAMFEAVAAERVNPEQMRIASEAMRNLDWQRAISGSGARASGSSLANRSRALSGLERGRKEAINQFVQSQNDLYNKWYTQEMENYMTSKAPSEYQLNKYGIELPESIQGSYTPETKYEYNPVVDFEEGVFGWIKSKDSFL